MHSFDYVVVGAGSAGCVVAARLSEDPHTKVLLVEAGTPDGPESMAVPPAWPSLIGSSADWGFITVPQAGTMDVVHPYPRGKVFGGSSSINAMAFLRGHRDSYDAWAANGATGWAYEDLLPYFKRSERAAGRDPRYRGTDGPMTVAPPSDGHPLAYVYLEAAAEAGHAASPDLNGEHQEGAAWLEVNIVDGRRFSVADAYLRPILTRPNLTVISSALVHRVVVAGGRCTGIEYSINGELRGARAEREVILSAGSIGSAQLLMLSGLGPAAHLREHGIDVLADLPGVGANLQDHPLAGITYSATRPVPPTANQHSDLIAMVRTRPELTSPDLQLIFLDIMYHPPTLIGPEHGYTIGFSLMRPHSTGSVRLTGAHPAAAPLIDPNFLGDERDVETMVTALRMAREVGEADALAGWRGKEELPSAAVQDDAGLATYVRSVTGPYFHPVGTCRIGDDPLGVVDTKLRVHGVDGLRVVDASVMPTIVAANPNATVIAIAERAADLISA